MQPAGHLQEHERGEIELRMTKNKSRLKKITSREPYQTVSTVYFILGILRTDLWSQGTLCHAASKKIDSFFVESSVVVSSWCPSTSLEIHVYEHP